MKFATFRTRLPSTTDGLGATTFTPETHIDLIHPMVVVQIQNGKGSFADLITVQDPPALKLVFPEFRADLYK